MINHMNMSINIQSLKSGFDRKSISTTPSTILYTPAAIRSRVNWLKLYRFLNVHALAYNITTFYVPQRDIAVCFGFRQIRNQINFSAYKLKVALTFISSKIHRFST